MIKREKKLTELVLSCISLDEVFSQGIDYYNTLFICRTLSRLTDVNE